MARAAFDITGTLGNLIFYQMNGKTYVRTRPTQRRKGGPEEELAHQQFGLASKYGSNLLQRLKGELYHPIKSAGHNKVRGWIYSQIKKYGDNAEWKIDSSNKDFCSMYRNGDAANSIRLDIRFTQLAGGAVEVAIPSFVPALQISAPANAVVVTTKMMLVGSAFSGLSPKVSLDTKEWTFPWRYTEQAAHSFILSPDLMPGDMMMLVLEVKYTIVERQQEFVCQLPEHALAAVLGMGRV